MRVVALEDHFASSLACGQYHTVIVTNKGEVFSCGKNDYGQLGTDSNESIRIPARVTGPLDREHILTVRCGYYHTLVLSRSSRVLAFGRNDYGQCGLGHTTQRVYGAQPILELESKTILRIAAGCYHSICVSESGIVYVFGRNNHGQLGNASFYFFAHNINLLRFYYYF